MGFSVGRSSYGDLRGAEQFVSTADIAAQVASLCLEFDTTVAKDGDHLTVNEGIRSVERQILLYDQYLHHGGALAAYATSGPPKRGMSTHDPSRGSALDFGITGADGSNRALTPAEFDWVHSRGPLRGIQWTGRLFSRVEPWHHNGGYPAVLPPILGAPLPGTAHVTKEEDDMSPEQDQRLKRLEELVEGLHKIVSDKDRGVATRVARILDDTGFIKREFTVPVRGVRDRLASILTKLKGGN